MAGVINFVEHQRQVYLHDFLIYVCGVDISAHVKELKITYTDKSSPGSADISLTNPFDQWILTDANFKERWRRTSDRYTETPKYQIYQNKIKLAQASFAAKVKQNVSLSPKEAPQDNSSDNKYEPFTNPDNPQQDFLQRYSFGPGSCIFSKLDTVKIFIKNPLDPSEADRWMPAFTGTVDSKPFTTNYVNGDSSVTLTCYDLRSTLNYMRMSVAPYKNSQYSSTGPNSGAQREKFLFIDQDAAGPFKDYYPGLKQGNGNKDPKFDNTFQGKSFVDMVSMITCGFSNWVLGNTPTETGGGVGFFQPGKVFRYANSNNKQATGSNLITSLEAWDNLCLFGTYNNNAGNKDRTPTWLTYQDCDYIGKRSFWDSSKTDKSEGKTYKAFTPLNGYVHFLIPAEGLNISDMIKTSVGGIQNLMGSPEWTSRLSLINNACEMVDYDFSITGSGDIIFEFPMYDFFPDNYGTNASIYMADKHISNEQISDEGGDVISAVEASGESPALIQDAKNTAGNASAMGTANPLIPKALAYSNVLVSKYGVRIASKTFTGIAQGQLHNMATLELQKRLADANKMSMDISYRPFLRPNRPLHHIQRNRIGRTTSVSLSLIPLREATISAAMNCVRTSLMINGKIEFQHVFGGPGMTLSYNTIFEAPDSLGKKKTGGQNNSSITTNVDTAKSDQ